MIKLLYKLFEKQLNKYVFNEGIKYLDWRDKCKVSFIDDEGRKYYSYDKDYKMPIRRMTYMDTLKIQYTQSWSQLHQNEFDKLLSSLFIDMEKGLQFQHYYKKVAQLKTLLEEKDKRRNQVILVDLMYELIACYFIREDEDPNEVNELLLAEKVETFKKKATYQFLKHLDMMQLIGLSEITEEQFSQLLERSLATEKAMQKLFNFTTK